MQPLAVFDFVPLLPHIAGAAILPSGRSATTRPLPMPSPLHLISSLPRSGPSLLAALLRQNPRFHAGMTSRSAPST